MSYGVQPPAKKPSSLPRILTIICSVLAVIFLLVSATMYVSARSKAQEIEDMRAEIQSTDAKTVEIDSEILLLAGETPNSLESTGRIG